MAQGRTATKNVEAARIGRGTRVRGRIAGEGDLTVSGAVEGDITLRGNLVVEAGAELRSDVLEALDVTIGGTLEGNVHATGQVHVAAGAAVRGDLRGAGVSIDDGAQFAGRIEMDFDLPAELQEGR